MRRRSINFQHLFHSRSCRTQSDGQAGAAWANPPSQAIIGVTGCMANAKKDTLFQKLPHIDFVLGTNNIHELNQVLDEVLVHRQADGPHR